MSHTFASALAQLMGQRNLTAYRLAAESGVSERYIRDLLSGAKTPGIDVALRLAQGLGVQLVIVDGQAVLPLAQSEGE